MNDEINMMYLSKIVLSISLLVTIFISTSCSEHETVTKEYVDDDPQNTTNYRLPGNVIPNEYRINIRITPFVASGNFSFDGVVKINATVIETASEIVLHADDVTIHNLTVVSAIDKENDSQLTEIDVEDVKKKEKYQFLSIRLKSPITAGTNVTIEISYTGKLSNDTYGVFRDWVKVEKNYKWIVGTQFEPTGARKAFPCFDEPGLKATFQIVLVVPEGYTALSNMPIEAIVNCTDTNETMFEFERSPVMSSYTVAFVAVEYASLAEPLLPDETRQPRLYRVWSNPELAYQLPYALRVIPKVVEFFHNKTSLEYPISKLEMVAFPDFPPAAMENWGLILYSEMFMLYEEKVTPLRIKRYIRNLVTHELSHQWFGNLVTPKWWDYLWLSESFAAYFEYHAHEDELDFWNLESEFVVNEMHEAFVVDAYPTIHPMTHEVYSPQEIIAVFDSISYNKGACIVRMIEKLLGSKLFFGALQLYLEANQYSSATPELLFSAFEDAVNKSDYKWNVSISEFMESWTTQSGYPVVHASFNGNTVTLRQNRFFLQPATSEISASNTTWIVPITWASSSKSNFNDTGIDAGVDWLIADEAIIMTIPNAINDWVIINVQQTGYYRVNYDNNMWQRIIEFLKSDDYEIIHELNRAALMNDLFNLGRADYLDYRLVLSASQYLSRETNYIPWRTSFAGLMHLKKRFMGYPEIYSYFKVYVTSLLEPHYKRLGFNEINGEKDFDILFREILLKWLCELDYKECIDNSLALFQKLQQNDSFVISPNLQTAVYCTAMRHGSFQDWDYLWNRLQNTNFAIEKLTILTTLICTKNSTNLNKLLRAVLTADGDRIRKQDIKDIITTMADASLLGANEIFNFLEANYEEILKMFNDNSVIEHVLMTSAESMSTDRLVEKYAGFIDKNSKKIDSIADTLASILKSVRYELDWNHRHIPIILKWLKKNYSKVESADKNN